jgi:hypothetical protein
VARYDGEEGGDSLARWNLKGWNLKGWIVKVWREVRDLEWLAVCEAMQEWCAEGGASGFVPLQISQKNY